MRCVGRLRDAVHPFSHRHAVFLLLVRRGKGAGPVCLGHTIMPYIRGAKKSVNKVYWKDDSAVTTLPAFRQSKIIKTPLMLLL